MSQIDIKKELAASVSEFTRYLSFALGGEDYAIPLLSVREVLAVPDFTPIPFTPNYFLGLMNLRGQVISVVDLRAKFGIKPTEMAENAVIICDLGTTNLGVVVDSIHSVLSPSPDQISDKPAMQGSKASEYVSAVFRNGERLVLLIDLFKTFSIDQNHIHQKPAA